MLNDIVALYAVEDTVRNQAPEERAVERAARATPIMNRLLDRLRAERSRHLHRPGRPTQRGQAWARPEASA